MVHVRTVVNPMVSPVTVELGSFAEEADPEPEKVVQVPVSETFTELAASEAVVTPQRFCVGPAAAIVVMESEFIVTSEVVGPQPPNPEVMVHLRIVVLPIVSPVTDELGSFADEADPEPESVVHAPVSATLGVFAASVPEVVLQRFCVGPAAATVIAEATLIVTSEVVGAHPPNSEVMVHVRTVVNPMVSPVTVELGSFAEEADPEPEKVVQVPVSETFTELAASEAVVTPQRFCVGPAAAIVVMESEFIVTSEVVGPQPPNPEVMVHLRIVVLPIVSPVTDELGSFADEADPEPESVVNVPVSATLGVFAASVPEVVLQRF